MKFYKIDDQVVFADKKLAGGTELVANTTDGAAEKHVPVITISSDEVHVAVGSVEHPSQEAHYIEWICIETNTGIHTKWMKPRMKPEGVFKLMAGESVVAAYEYCNLHGLWMSKEKRPKRRDGEMYELNIWDKWEFIYELGGKYYLLGKHVCEECVDQAVIDLYKEFEDVTNCEEFNSCNDYRDVRDKVSIWNRDVIAESYKKVSKACYTQPIEHWTAQMASLRCRLEERYQDEMTEQLRRILIARECEGLKQLDEDNRRRNSR